VVAYTSRSQRKVDPKQREMRRNRSFISGKSNVASKLIVAKKGKSEPLWIVFNSLGFVYCDGQEQLGMFVLHSDTLFFFKFIIIIFFPMWLRWGFQPKHKLTKGEKA
jgi:hypothetical protein